jgi:hypothetical protein
VRSSGARQQFPPTQQLGADLGEFLKAVVELVEGARRGAGALLGGGVLEEELLDVTDGQALGQVVERAVLPALGAGAVGFAAGSETFDDAGAEEVRGQVELGQEAVAALRKARVERRWRVWTFAISMVKRHGLDEAAGENASAPRIRECSAQT